MHRRSFVTLLAASFVAVPLAARAETPITWARRNFEPIDPEATSIIGIHPLVNVFPDAEAAAEQLQNLQTLGHPASASATPETWDPIEILPAPEGFDDPVVMRRWQGVAVVDAVTHDAVPHVSVDVQRDAAIVSLMVRGLDDAAVIDLATSLAVVMAAYPLPTTSPSQDETGRHTGGIWDLLLQENDAPDGFRLYQEADDNGAVTFAG